jgi:hypothetical protein
VNPLDFLQAIAGYTRNAPSDGSTGADNAPPSTKRSIRLATIDPAYSSFGTPYPNGIAPARVTFEGEDTLSGKYYPVAAGLIPYAGQRVYLLPVGTTYMIAGAVSAGESQGFYGGTATGVEFGNGNYFDVLEGLSLDTDADIGGALAVGDSVDVGAMRLISNEKVASGLLSTGTNATTNYSNVNGAPGMSFTKKYSGTYTKFIITMKMSARNTAGVVPATVRIGVNISGGSGDHDIDHAVFQTVNVHYPLFGTRELTGFAAGTYTITPRIRNVSASTLQVDSNDYYSLHVKEVSV